MLDNQSLKKYVTKNGVFLCSESIDKKIVYFFERDNGSSLGDIELIKYFVDSDSIIYDVGAHIGTFSVPLAKVAKKVYAFEPNKVNAEILKANLELNNVANVEVIENPVAEKKKLVSLLEQSVSGQSYLVEDQGGTEAVMLDETKEPADLIKIDVEGYELKVLQGGENLIKAKKPILYLEYVKAFVERAGNDTRQLNDFLQVNNYAIYLYLTDNKVVPLPSINFLLKKGNVSNLLCVPKDRVLPKEIIIVPYTHYFARELMSSVKNKLTR